MRLYYDGYVQRVSEVTIHYYIAYRVDCLSRVGTGKDEIQFWSNLDRDQFFALYVVRRTIFEISYVSLDTDTFTKDTFCGS